MYLGNFVEDSVFRFYWQTFDKNGASITRSTNGTVKIRRSDGTEITAGITDNEDTPDTGIHEVIIDSSAHVNYAVSYDYMVWVDGMVVDGETINSVLGMFSVENRIANVNKLNGNAQSLLDLKDFADTGYDPSTHKVETVKTCDASNAADVTKIGGNSVAGNAATLTLKQLDIQNSAGTAFIAKSTGSDGKGMDITGNGTGQGINVTAGSTAEGIKIFANGTSKSAILADASLGSGGHGIEAKGGDNGGDGMRLTGQAAGAGITLVAGTGGIAIAATPGSGGTVDSDIVSGIQSGLATEANATTNKNTIVAAVNALPSAAGGPSLDD